MTAVRYVAGGALSPANSGSYIERSADNDATMLLGNMDYLLVIEPRQQGKTSLLGHLSRTLANSERMVVYLDVEDLSYASEGMWYSGLWQDLRHQLPSTLGDVLDATPTDSQEWRHELKALAIRLHEKSTKLIIALDELGSMGRALWAEAFFVTLRKFYNLRAFSRYYGNITFVLSGAFNPRDLIKDDKISPFNVAQPIHLEDFAVTQVEELVGRGPWSPAQTIDLAERIHFWTDGQPYLTQLLCTYQRPDATPAEVDAGVERIRREDKNHVPPILERLYRDDKLRQYVDEVRAGKRIKFYPRENSRQAQLELLGVLKSDEQGYCRIRNRIYELALYPRDNPTSTFPVPVVGKDGSDAVILQDSELLVPMPLMQTDWVILKLQLSRQTNLEFEARVLDSPMGQPRANSRLPFDAVDLIAVLRVLEHNGYDLADFRLGQTEALQRLGMVRDGRLAPDHLKQIGQGLYDALFPGDVGVAFRMAFNQTRQARQTIFLQLRFDQDAVDLARYPWELLHDGQRHLVSAGAVEMTRYITYSEAVPTLPVTPPARLLFIESRPKGLTTLPSDAERQAAWNALQPMMGNGKLILDRLEPPTYKALLDRMGRADYHMIHFDGHGVFARRCPQCKAMNYPHLTTCHGCKASLEDVSPQGYLAFENSSRQADFVSTAAMENLLLNSQVRLMFLSACQTGVVRGDSLFGGLGPGLIRAGVPAVVAMQFPVPVQATIDFAESFYTALARGETVSRAVAQGRRSLFRDGTWFIPTLYLRSQDDGGHIFAA